MDRYKFVFVFISLLSHCSCEISYEIKNKLMNGFIDFYNSRPNQIYTCEEGYLLNAQQSTELNSYNIEVTLKVSDPHDLDTAKYLKCTSKVVDLQDIGVSVLNHHCDETIEKSAEVEEHTVTETPYVTEAALVRKPVQLDNEIQTNTAVTSGEQFVAIPREEQKVHCIGCSSHVNPKAPGVSDLAEIGVRQLNALEPNIKHTLNHVVDVERQVQVVNGVRYILTMVIDFNSCVDAESENCINSKTCKVGFLEKPWIQLPDGSKHRAVLSNNCTAEWQFGDDGVVVAQTPTDSRETNNINPPQTGDGSDTIKPVHNVDVEAKPHIERTLTDNDVKVLEDQIIPYKHLHKHTNLASSTFPKTIDTEVPDKKHSVKIDSVNQFSVNSIPVTDTVKIESLSDDKKKVIDDMLSFFDFAGVESTHHGKEKENTRFRRSYDRDLNIMNLVEKFQKVKTNVDSAKQVGNLAQTVVDYLNEIDLEVKNRVLNEVLNAEEEFENHQHFYYIQSRVTIPCDKSECEDEDTVAKICNAVLDGTFKKIEILNIFCHDEPKSKPLGKANIVALDDPVLLKFVKEATEKIESESIYKKAMKVSRIIDANTQVVSGTVTKFSIVLDHTNCSNTVKQVFRSNCPIIDELGSQICDVTVHERHWLHEKKITFTCTERTVDTSFSTIRRTEVKKSVNDPAVQDMVNEALQYLEVQSNRNNKQMVVKVNSVATQLVAGFLTDIEFVVGYTTCTNDIKNEFNKCNLLQGEPLRICKAKVWDRTWIEEGRQVDVSCKDTNIENEGQKRTKRDLVTATTDVDVNSPEIKTLARESLKKYLKSSVYHRHFDIVDIQQASVQDVSGRLTKLKFTISPTTCLTDKEGNPSSSDCQILDLNDVTMCNSVIWEKSEENFKQIDITCPHTLITKRALSSLGGLKEKDPNNPKYRKLADESMQKYLESAGITNPHKILEIKSVSTQVVAGTKTIIKFIISPLNQNTGDTISCTSDIWEQSWKKFKEIKVLCAIDNQSRSKRGIPGGEQEQDPNDPKYRKLADESMQKYLESAGITNPHKILEIKSVSTQVVAGTKTIIEFIISPLNQNTGDTISCTSDIWEQSWKNFKEIKVLCAIDNQSRSKRGVPGGEQEQDPNDPKYRKLADESMQKYLESAGITNPHKILEIKSVSTQVVAGTKTIIEFIISPLNQNTGDTISCTSDIWEQSWKNFKEIKVLCAIDNQSRSKRGIPGSEQEQDPNDPKYRKLADESMQKYLESAGITNPHKILEIKSVSTQVAAGTKTIIKFIISPLNQNTGDTISCTSDIWEQSWKKIKEIKVLCAIDNQSRSKRGIPGGEQEQDPNDPKYRKLADESMQKYLESAGITNPHKILEIKSVSTQVVAGTKTIIKFIISPLNQNTGDTISCTSDIWERPWDNFKEIKVLCAIDNNIRKRRDVAHENFTVRKLLSLGEETHEDVNKPEFKTLAKESLQKFLQTSGGIQHYVVISIERASVQLASGTITRLEFNISPTNCQVNGDGKPLSANCKVVNARDVISCYSEISEQKWLHSKDIDVTCHVEDLLNKVKLVTPPGHSFDVDPSEPEYKELAYESMQKYIQNNDISNAYQIDTIQKVTHQLLSVGTLIKIDLKISPVSQTNGDQKNCHSQIWEKDLVNKEISVKCSNAKQHRKKRAIFPINPYQTSASNEIMGGLQEQDPSNIEFKALAQKSLKKFLKRQKNSNLHSVVEVNKVTARIVSGIMYTIEFVAAPVSCAHHISTCIDESSILYCTAKVWRQPWLGKDEVDVDCTQKYSKSKIRAVKSEIKDIEDAVHKNRSKRQAGGEDYVDEDISHFYAERAVRKLNERSGTDNLYKLITVYGVERSLHMNQPLVRMYLEVAETYCVRRGDEGPPEDCEELAGTGHPLCLARFYPESEDDMIVRSVAVTCTFDPDFERVSGLSVENLLYASLTEIQKSPKIKNLILNQGEMHLVPSLDLTQPMVLSFMIAATNCSKDLKRYYREPNLVYCAVDISRPTKSCTSHVYVEPNTNAIRKVSAKCTTNISRRKRSVLQNPSNSTADDLIIQSMVQASLDKLEMASVQRYKQRVLQINSYSTKITSGKVTTIDFDVGFTSCLKFEWVDDIRTCQFLEHLPRRHCVTQVWERLWLDNGKNIDVTCEEEEAPLEAHIEFESAEAAMKLANESLKHIDAKYPRTRKQKVVRIFSLEKQVVAGIHYRMKLEVGPTTCVALSAETGCKLDKVANNMFCRVNVWLRPWTDHPPSFRVVCDYQEAAASELYHQIQAEALFSDFLTTYKPEYMKSAEELANRFKIFKANVKKIHELNVHEKGTATYGVTRFADLTYEEFSQKFLGLKPSLRDYNQVPMRQAEIPSLRIPDKFDWRDYGAVTEVKNQGSCGSCWAFSVTGNIEGQWKMQSGQLVSLSEQELVDCDKLDNGCNGGLPDNAYRAIEQLGGLELENDYPYEGEDDTCAFNKTKTRVQISGAVNITSNETDMAQWLVQNGPISIGINANAMQFYMGGVSHPWKMLCNPSNLDHGVLIVGYGIKDYPLFHKRLPYWTIKNSWGPGWGEQGYYRVYRGDGTCGVNQMASSSVI